MGFLLLEQLYAAALSLLAPPYLYFTVNFIILVIAVSSFIHTSPEEAPSPPAAELIKFLEPPPEQQTAPKEELIKFLEPPAEQQIAPKEELPPEKPLVSSRFSLRRTSPAAELVKFLESPPEQQTAPKEELPAEKPLVSSRFSLRRTSPAAAAAELIKFLEPPAEQQTALKEELPAEKPLVSSRFSLRRSPKQSPEGKMLGVAKLKRNDSMESTWKAISGGGKERLEEGALWARAREASLGREDLNRRAEAFIRKIRGDVRIRRQESFKRFSQSFTRRAQMLEMGRDRAMEGERESSPG